MYEEHRQKEWWQVATMPEFKAKIETMTNPHEVGLLKEEIKSVVARIRGQLAQGENEGWRKKATAALNFVLEKQHVLARYEKKLKWDLRESGKLKKVLREVTSDEIEEIRELIDKGDHGEALHLLTDIVEDSLL